MLRGLRKHWRWGGGGAVALALAGCAGHYFVQREPWRKEAELACLKSGSVKETGSIVRIEPINGPGMCGADYPFKVAALGENSLLSYMGELRPPGDVPGQPRWPVTSDPYAARTSAPPRNSPPDGYYANPMRPPVERQPLYQPNAIPSAAQRGPAAPLEIAPPPDRYGAPRAQDGYLRVPSTPTRKPSVYDAPADDDDDDMPPSQAARAATTQRHAAPYPDLQPDRSSPARTPVSVPMGRGAVAAVGPVEIKPAATLACPMVSALDRWILDSVQPAAQRWFRQPVVEIKQISAYSCRGMNGQPGARISEHAFGNALDIAAFTLADGRKITVKDGWRGSPEEQGFLRDVQGAACEQFNTVLAPGSNRFHYDHFHVDLMRRASGHRICNPDQIPGDVVAARVARERGYAWRPNPEITGSVAQRASKSSRSASLNGGKSRSKPKVRNILADDDEDWIEDDGPRPTH